ncbi:uncharacterized protein LOC123428814 [Hordeum vulgare subsp. vulgare]|uniref:uncharacterized protein LOC123428814 n=1 Tax=Hordeum vulgare subsp. vulgare TaxID=112509 RepID=UPI001D1A51CC|nr:uncharacterized protein LOC123428814 [Hordeum vulgare subsp. vulgare]
MSLACGLPLQECVYCLGCAWWASKRCVHTGTGYHDGATWGHAATADFAPIRRMCRLVMANYETDLAAPLLDPSNVVRRRTYADTGGLNLGRESDYALLLDNRLDKRRFEGGYVHNGLLQAAGWVLDKECDPLRDLLDRYPDYTGHSLGVVIRNWLQKSSELVTCLSSEFILFSAATAKFATCVSEFCLSACLLAATNSVAETSYMLVDTEQQLTQLVSYAAF